MSSGNSGRKQQGARDARTRAKRPTATIEELHAIGEEIGRRTRTEQGLCPIEYEP